MFFPVVVVIFFSIRLSNSNFVVEVDRDEFDEHTYDRLLVDKLVVVDINVGLSDAQAPHPTYDDVNRFVAHPFATLMRAMVGCLR